MQSTLKPLLPPLSLRSLVYLGVALAIVAVASWLGSSLTMPSIPGWYANLRKPWFNPPNWVFPVAWTSLFALMAFGFWRILRQVVGGEGRNAAIIAFLVQISVNVAWSFAFFWMQNVAAGLAVALCLVAAVSWMIVTFRRIDPLAGWLQLPYLAWASFAAFLNATILRIN